MTIPLGFIGVIFNDLENDFDAAVKQAAGIGYVGMELGEKSPILQARPTEETAAVLKDVGLHLLNWHTTNYEALLDGGSDFLTKIKPFQSKFITISYSGADSIEAIEREAEKLNAAGAKLREEGYFLCYHNHDHELQFFEGRTALDRLMDLTDPKLVQLQLDVAWAAFGGADPAALIRQYAWRVPLLHLKDVEPPLPDVSAGSPNRKEARLTDCGSGVVDFAAVLAAARDAGVAWGIVEKDRRDWHGPGMEALERSYLYLANLGWG